MGPRVPLSCEPRRESGDGVPAAWLCCASAARVLLAVLVWPCRFIAQETRLGLALAIDRVAGGLDMGTAGLPAGNFGVRELPGSDRLPAKYGECRDAGSA